LVFSYISFFRNTRVFGIWERSPSITEVVKRRNLRWITHVPWIEGIYNSNRNMLESIKIEQFSRK
jgi:hypothetical protein